MIECKTLDGSKGTSHNIPQHHATQPRDIGINNMHNQRNRQKNLALDLGPNLLPGAQQHTTVEPAAALTIQDKIEGKYDENI